MQIDHEIAIRASLDEVWALTTDIERWPELMSTVTSVERLDAGPLAVGSRARLKQPAQRAATWVVTELDAPHRFTWVSRRGPIEMTASHALGQHGDVVVNRLSVAITGTGSSVVGRLLAPVIRRTLRIENESFRARAESQAASAARPAPPTRPAPTG